MDTDILLELPKPLKAMLRQLMCNNELRGWNVYSNKHNQLCCNIRFGIVESGHVGESGNASLPIHDQTCSYRKVSIQQQARSKGRLDSFKDKYQVRNDSKKRKLENPSPELPRLDCDMLDTSANYIDSPDQPMKYQCGHVTHQYQIDSSSPITLSPKSDDASSCGSAISVKKSNPLEYHLAVPEVQTDPLQLESVTIISPPEPSQCDSTIVPHVEHIGFSSNVVSHMEPTYCSSSLVDELPDAESLEYDSDDKTLTPMATPSKSPSYHRTPHCPCCDKIMTLTHECDTTEENNLLSESLCEVSHNPIEPTLLNVTPFPESTTVHPPTPPMADPPDPPGDDKWHRFCNDDEYRTQALDKICKTQ